MTNVQFLVTTAPVGAQPRPVIGVDGPVVGADACYDHHATQEPVNLEAIPAAVGVPGTIVTTMLDTDAVISAAVVLLRADGAEEAVERCWPTLYEAAHVCDHLVPSGRYPDAERAGLGLHCWLKEKGFALGEVLAWSRGELANDPSPGVHAVPSPETKSAVFRHLTLAVVTAVRRGTLPCDFAYLDRLAGMEARARRAVRVTRGWVTLLEPEGFVDPLALYRAVETDVAVVMNRLPEGAFKYSLGVHPRAYSRINLEPVFHTLGTREPGWGGRKNAGGSPLNGGSRIPPDELVSLVNAALGAAQGSRQ